MACFFMQCFDPGEAEADAEADAEAKAEEASIADFVNQLPPGSTVVIFRDSVRRSSSSQVLDTHPLPLPHPHHSHPLPNPLPHPNPHPLPHPNSSSLSKS